MRTYRVISDHGARTPIFQIDNVYIGSKAVIDVLRHAQDVTEVESGKVRHTTADIVARFKYLGRPFLVWEPFGDNSRYWIGPADMVDGEPAVMNPPDTAKLESQFKAYRAPLHRAILGGILTLDVLRAVIGRARKKGAHG